MFSWPTATRRCSETLSGERLLDLFTEASHFPALQSPCSDAVPAKTVPAACLADSPATAEDPAATAGCRPSAGSSVLGRVLLLQGHGQVNRVDEVGLSEQMRKPGVAQAGALSRELNGRRGFPL